MASSREVALPGGEGGWVSKSGTKRASSRAERGPRGHQSGSAGEQSTELPGPASRGAAEAVFCPPPTPRAS